MRDSSTRIMALRAAIRLRPQRQLEQPDGMGAAPNQSAASPTASNGNIGASKGAGSTFQNHCLLAIFLDILPRGRLCPGSRAWRP